MKSLFVAVLLLSLLPFAACAQNGKQQQAQSEKQPHPTATPAAPTKQGDGTSLGPTYSNQQQGDHPIKVAVTETPPKDGYDKTAVWIGGIGLVVTIGLLVVGIYGVLYAKKTLDKLEHHAIQFEKLATFASDNAAAAKDTAEAARLHAQAIINAERGRITLRVEKMALSGSPGKSRFAIQISNSGRSLVHIQTFGKPTEIATAFPKKLPVPPVYPEGPEPIDGSVVNVGSPPHTMFEFIPNSSENTVRKMEAHRIEGGDLAEQKILVFGEIRYTDGISPNERTCRYCLRWDNSDFSNIGGKIVTDGPDEYNTGI